MRKFGSILGIVGGVSGFIAAIVSIFDMVSKKLYSEESLRESVTISEIIAEGNIEMPYAILEGGMFLGLIFPFINIIIGSICLISCRRVFPVLLALSSIIAALFGGLSVLIAMGASFIGAILVITKYENE